MGRAETLLFRKSLKILKAYRDSNIPFTGIYGTSLVNWGLDGERSLKAWFRQGGSEINNLQIGTACLGLAEEQLKILQNSGEEARQGMLEWEDARLRVTARRQFQNETENSLFGCQIGMDTISRQISAIIDPFDLDPLPEDPTEDILRNLTPFLVEASPNSDREKLEAFVHGIYVKMKYKYEPFEWLYEGLKPILKSNVLSTKKGTPAALSLCLSALGEKVDLMLLPMPDIQVGGPSFMNNDVYSSFIDSLPTESAMRLKSKTQSVLPEPNTWYLRLDNGFDRDPLYINCKKGLVMDFNDMMDKNPALASMTLTEWRQQSVLRTWAGLADLAVQAHQRRGESDLVAHWIYLKLSLDPLATEWERAITPPEVVSVE